MRYAVGINAGITVSTFVFGIRAAEHRAEEMPFLRSEHERARIVGDDERTVRTNAIAHVRPAVLIVYVLLRAIFRDGITPRPSAVRTKFGNPVEHRNRKTRFSTASARFGNETVAVLAGRGARIR